MARNEVNSPETSVSGENKVLAYSAIAVLVVQQPKLFVTERQLDLIGGKCAFGNFQRTFSHANGFR